MLGGTWMIFFCLGLLLKSENNWRSNTIDDVINEVIVPALKIGKKSAVGVEISPIEQFQVKKLHQQDFIKALDNEGDEDEDEDENKDDITWTKTAPTLSLGNDSEYDHDY